MNSSLPALTAAEEDDVLQLNLGCTGHSKIHRIEGLDRFSRLTTLILNNQMIAKMEGLQHLHQLRVLNLQFNQIRICQGLDQCPGLEELYLSYNSIRSVRQKLDVLPCLRILQLAHNELAIEHLSCLAAASQLTILSLHGNPLTKQITYHTLIGLVFAKLVILDEKEVRRVEVDIMTEQVSFLRGALNQVLQEKNELLAEATKIKRELTSQSEAAGRTQQLKEESIDQQRQEKLFYVQALHEQNRILQQKIEQCQREIAGRRHKRRTINHYQSVKLAQQLQQQAIVEQLSTELEKKYMETTKLQKRLEKLKRQNSSKHQQQKVLSQLYNNQILIRSCHEQIEAIKRQTQDYSLEEQPLEQSGGESATESQLHHLQAQLDRFRQKLDQNLFLIRQYREDLRSSRCVDDSRLYHRLVFGERSQQCPLQDLVEFVEKYPAGLLPTISELFTLTFGGYVQLETVKGLADKLGGVPLIQMLAQKKEKVSEKKNRSASKKAFLEEKFNFIREFEKETKQLAAQWASLNEQKQQFEKQMEVKKVQFYQQLNEKMKSQQEKLEARKERFLEQQEKHRKTISHFEEEQQRRRIDIKKLDAQIAQVSAHFQTKFQDLEEFERNFSELKAQKSNLIRYHSQIERMKLEGQRLSESLAEREKSLRELEQQQLLLENRVQALERKSKERLNTMLEIDTKQKDIVQKLSRAIVEHNQLTQKIELKEGQLKVLEEETKDYERSMERARTNYSTWQEKLSNLNAIEFGKRSSLADLDRQISELEEAIKARLRINEDLQLRRDRLMQEANIYQLKIVESKASLDSLTSLNNAISKMSVHHKQLKTSVLELQIIHEGKLRDKSCLQQSIRQLQRQQSNLLDRISKLKAV